MCLKISDNLLNPTDKLVLMNQEKFENCNDGDDMLLKTNRGGMCQFYYHTSTVIF